MRSRTHVKEHPLINNLRIGLFMDRIFLCIPHIFEGIPGNNGEDKPEFVS